MKNQPAYSMEKVGYGGIVIDDGRVLLREPAGHAGGYHWTFPRVESKDRETPEQTALRAVWEKAGVRARIVHQLPGVFAGELTHTSYFLMVSLERGAAPAAVEPSIQAGWYPYQEAKAKLGESKTSKGRQRDLEVLAVAWELHCLLDHVDRMIREDPRQVERENLTVSALRIDGWRYIEEKRLDLDAAEERYDRTGELPEDELDRLAMFFRLQRYLMKWGGDYLSDRSHAWKLFRELYLNTCAIYVPSRYRYLDEQIGYERWEREQFPRLRECIALTLAIHQATEYQPGDELNPNYAKLIEQANTVKREERENHE